MLGSNIYVILNKTSFTCISENMLLITYIIEAEKKKALTDDIMFIAARHVSHIKLTRKRSPQLLFIFTFLPVLSNCSCACVFVSWIWSHYYINTAIARLMDTRWPLLRMPCDSHSIFSALTWHFHPSSVLDASVWNEHRECAGDPHAQSCCQEYTVYVCVCHSRW